MDPSAPRPPQAADFIPHRAPMLMVGEILESAEKHARARTRFDAEHYAVRRGRVMEAALVEAVAQTVGVMLSGAAAERREASGGNAADAEPGMLTGVSDFRFHAPVLAGEELVLEVREKKRLGPMALVVGRVLRGAQVVAEGEIKVYG